MYTTSYKFPTTVNLYLEQLVLLAQLHRLLPPVVALEQVGADAPELHQLVALQLLSERDVVKVVEGVDGGFQALRIVIIYSNLQLVLHYTCTTAY